MTLNNPADGYHTGLFVDLKDTVLLALRFPSHAFFTRITGLGAITYFFQPQR